MAAEVPHAFRDIVVGDNKVCVCALRDSAGNLNWFRASVTVHRVHVRQLPGLPLQTRLGSWLVSNSLPLLINSLIFSLLLLQ